ncbi:MAG: hypothetical protein ACM3JH_06835, partial [Acidithiobacillales bacterium]
MIRSDLGAAALVVPSSTAEFVLPHLAPLRREPLKVPAFANGYLEATRNFRGAAKLFHAVSIAPRFPDVIARVDLPRGSNLSLPLERLPKPLRAPVERLFAALVVADSDVKRAWQGVPVAVSTTAATRKGLTEDIPDGQVPLADVETAGRGMNGETMARAALEVVAAVERAGADLKEAVKTCDPATLATLRSDVDTTFGRIRVAGTGNDRHLVYSDERPFLLIVDLGGDDSYIGSHAAGIWPAQRVSVVIDLCGNDTYEAGPGEPSQGSGLGGVGILWDAAGNDRYEAAERSQGFAQFGAGILVDDSGNDDYRLGVAGQGAALFGTALLLDQAGDDRYQILHDGQGYG